MIDVRALLIEFRRSPGLFVFPLVIVVQLAATFSKLDAWQGSWQAASSAAVLPTILTAPLVAACGAWAGHRYRIGGVREVIGTSPRSTNAAVWIHLAAAAIWMVGAYVVGILAVVVTQAIGGDGGRPWPSYLLEGILTQCAALAFGYGVVARFPYWATLPVVPVLVYAFFIVAQYSNGLLNRLSPWPGNVVDAPWFETAPLVLVSRVLLLLGIVATAALTAAIAIRESTPARILRIGSSLIVVIAVVLGAVQPANMQRRAPVADPACLSVARRLCAWPEHAHLLRDSASSAGNMINRLLPYVDLPGVIAEPGLSESGAFLVLTNLPHDPRNEMAVAGGILNGTLPELSDRCMDQNPAVGENYRLVTEFLVSVALDWQPGLASPTDADRLDRLRKMDPFDARSWITGSLARLKVCGPP